MGIHLWVKKSQKCRLVELVLGGKIFQSPKKIYNGKIFFTFHVYFSGRNFWWRSRKSILEMNKFFEKNFKLAMYRFWGANNFLTVRDTSKCYRDGVIDLEVVFRIIQTRHPCNEALRSYEVAKLSSRQSRWLIHGNCFILFTPIFQKFWKNI